MRVAAVIDTTSLSPEEAQDLQGLVDAAQFFDLPSHIASPAPAVDQFEYKLAVRTSSPEAGERQHAVRVGDAAVPETLQPLLRRLTVLARTQAPPGDAPSAQSEEPERKRWWEGLLRRKQ
jgi:hypothetical protein